MTDKRMLVLIQEEIGGELGKQKKIRVEVSTTKGRGHKFRLQQILSSPRFRDKEAI